MIALASSRESRAERPSVSSGCVPRIAATRFRYTAAWSPRPGWSITSVGRRSSLPYGSELSAMNVRRSVADSRKLSLDPPIEIAPRVPAISSCSGLPASAVLRCIVPSAPVAVALILMRAALSQMDVPVRQALVMRVVDPDERAAAASITNVPRSLATALTPALAGALLDWSHFGWPLILAGMCKATYDILLLRQPLDRD